jgi:hypothetical protein
MDPRMDPRIVARAGHVSGQASARPFNVEAPGYDQPQVYEHIRQAGTQARQLRERERPGSSAPGPQIEQLLRLAEEHIASR